MTEHVSLAYAREVAGRFAQDLLGALIVVADDGAILAWNDGAAALFGFASDEVIGKSIFDTIIPPDIVRTRDAWIAAATASSPGMGEAVRSRKDGRRIWVDVT